LFPLARLSGLSLLALRLVHLFRERPLEIGLNSSMNF
jgi:hypothetical protein